LHHKVNAVEGSDFDLFESIDFRDIDEFDKGLV
jgi:hypothetical protein